MENNREDYRPLVYCPSCWPADAGERNGDVCVTCGSNVREATPSETVDLLHEQIGAMRKMCWEKMGRSYESMAVELTAELAAVIMDSINVPDTPPEASEDKGQVH